MKKKESQLYVIPFMEEPNYNDTERTDQGLPGAWGWGRVQFDY